MAREIKGIAIIIGDEVLLGDVQDINTPFIGKSLLENGFSLQEVLISSDTMDELSRALRYAASNADFVITSGGLGPTEDDCTRSCIAHAFGLKLEINEPYRKSFKNLLMELNIPWKTEFEDMTRLPSGAEKLAVNMPMAGFKLRVNNTYLYCLPGVPREVRYLMVHEVIPDLRARFPERLCYRRRVIRVYNLHEWEIAEKLKGSSVLNYPEVSIGYLPKVGGETWVTILVKGSSQEKAETLLYRAEQDVLKLVGPENVSGVDDKGRLEVVVGNLLRSKGWRLAVSESCTGGLLADTIVSVPGASDYFERGYIVYSNEAKADVLGISKDILNKHGAVSEIVAREMAKATQKIAGVDVAIGTTGIAGPSGGSKEKPVGTVFIGCAVKDRIVVRGHLFSGSRRDIQFTTVLSALKLLWEMLK